jgi:hypothetical protein
VATVPVFDTSESRSTEQGAALRFGRLERVRALQRTRRRRVALAALAVAVLVGGFLLVLTPGRGRSTDRASEPVTAPSGRPSPLATPARPALPPSPSVTVPRVDAPPSPPAAPAHDVVRRRAPAPPTVTHDVNAIPRAAVADPEADDPTAIIDWLLHSSRTHAR